MKKYIGLFILGLASASANAAFISGPVAEDAYVTFGGYDLAWASPCSDGLLESSCGAIDMTEQAGYGWQVMTSDLFAALGISASTFIVEYSSTNTEHYSGQNYAKAVRWFSNNHQHIDVIDGIAGRWSFADKAETTWYETIVYRQSISIASVPAPTSVAVLGLGLALLGFSRKNKAAK